MVRKGLEEDQADDIPLENPLHSILPVSSDMVDNNMAILQGWVFWVVRLVI